VLDALPRAHTMAAWPGRDDVHDGGPNMRGPSLRQRNVGEVLAHLRLIRDKYDVQLPSLAKLRDFEAFSLWRHDSRSVDHYPDTISSIARIRARIHSP